MSNFDLENSIANYAIESGDMTAVPEGGGALTEVIEAEYRAAQEPGLTDLSQAADKAAGIASQLEDLAARAASTPVDNAAIAAVSAESLHREYTAIMRAHGYKFRSESFESAASDATRIAGIAKDAAMLAKHSRQVADDLVNLSAESGAFSRFMRNDVTRLANARKALNTAKGELSAVSKDVDEHPVEIDHQGLRRFLTKNNEPVHNLRAAIDEEAQWFSHAFKFVEDTTSSLLQMVRSAKAGDLSQLEHFKTTVAVNSASPGSISLPGVDAMRTYPGQLLGQYGIDAELRRTHQQPGTMKANLTHYGKQALRVGLPALAGVAIGGGVGYLIGKGAMAAMGVGATLGGNVGGLASSAYASIIDQKAHRAELNKSTIKSSASAGDLKSAIDTVLGFEKYTAFKINKGEHSEIAKAIDELAPDGKALANHLLRLIVRAADAVYEHAIYVTVEMAVLADYTVRNAKK